MPIACKKTARGSDSEAKATANLMVHSTFLDFEQQKKRALAPAEGPGAWFATKGAKGGLNPVFFLF